MDPNTNQQPVMTPPADQPVVPITPVQPPMPEPVIPVQTPVEPPVEPQIPEAPAVTEVPPSPAV